MFQRFKHFNTSRCTTHSSPLFLLCTTPRLDLYVHYTIYIPGFMYQVLDCTRFSFTRFLSFLTCTRFQCNGSQEGIFLGVFIWFFFIFSKIDVSWICVFFGQDFRICVFFLGIFSEYFQNLCFLFRCFFTSFQKLVFFYWFFFLLFFFCVFFK